VTGVPQEQGRRNNVLLYVDILEMYTGICCVLSRCVSLDEACHSTILHTQDSVQCLLALLDPDIYCEFLNRFLLCSVASSSSSLCGYFLYMFVGLWSVCYFLHKTFK
jgi:hypothetical protein